MGILTDHGDLIAYGRWFLSNPDLPHEVLLSTGTAERLF
jgi:2,4-dienoyl-CoA reductase-like NADH-dependent reductase (Old Yellow Enzyme family)